MSLQTLIRISAAAGAAVLLTACPGPKEQPGHARNGAMPPVPVNVAAAVTKDMPLEVRTFGNAEPIATVGIKAQVGGELIDVSFKEGQDVKKGDLLFTIQPRLFATQLAQANANLERDRAQAASAQLNLQRQEDLDKKKSGVKEELERARALAASSAATVAADEALVLIAETQLGYTTIEAPMDGRTGAIRLRPGNLIKAGDDLPLTTLVQISPIYVTFALPEKHLAAVRKGMEGGGTSALTVIARDPEGGQTLGEGTVTFIANTVDATTGTVQLKATFPNGDRSLWPGAFLDVSLRLSTTPGATVIPSSAVTISQRGSQVFVVKEDNTVEPRVVTVSRSAGQETLVEKGIASGEKVVTNGQSRLFPGAKVVAQATPSAPVPPPADKSPDDKSPAPAIPAAPAGKPAPQKGS
jgi:membrane fusion protein, multidrug efflux system